MAKFSDIDLNFTKNPVSGDINILTDDVAVKRSVRNLVLTSKFERLMQPEVDCRVSDRLFENMTPVTEVRIEQAIRNTLQIHEPRIEVIDIIIDGKEDQNTINILVVFRIKNTTELIQVPIRMERIR